MVVNAEKDTLVAVYAAANANAEEGRVCAKEFDAGCCDFSPSLDMIFLETVVVELLHSLVPF